ncbi:hypothetical protein [Chitinophaga sp. ARDCPP14]|uniref:hypothetical protein n=1 Tax=Chitinophaga sp. ARDCPP14 TaxID=3391139 RepID=UPI003F528891
MHQTGRISGGSRKASDVKFLPQKKSIRGKFSTSLFHLPFAGFMEMQEYDWYAVPLRSVPV